MICLVGILHSGLVSSSVVMASCQIRRLVCGEEGEMSKLHQKHKRHVLKQWSVLLPRRIDIYTYEKSFS